MPVSPVNDEEPRPVLNAATLFKKTTPRRVDENRRAVRPNATKYLGQAMYAFQYVAQPAGAETCPSLFLINPPP